MTLKSLIQRLLDSRTLSLRSIRTTNLQTGGALC